MTISLRTGKDGQWQSLSLEAEGKPRAVAGFNKGPAPLAKASYA